jgi:hypothetical protein
MKQQALPRDINGQRLCQLFNYPWKWIETPSDTITADWKTNDKYPIKPRVLWARWQDAATIVGVRFAPTTSYAMIDIDAGSDYIESTQRIRWALETIGITRVIIVRSSFSGGLHIYIPFPHPYRTFSVACAIRQCLEAQGFKLAPGQLEVFPNEKPYGKSWIGEFFEYNGHRLPLQPGTGSCILDDDLQPISQDLSRFFALWDNAVQVNDHYEILEALSVARGNRRRQRCKANGKCQEWKDDLETVINEGWTGHGQTNDMLKAIATYGRVFEKLSGIELQRYVVKIALDRPGIHDWCNHLFELAKRCMAWARAVEKYYWPIGSEPLRERKSLMDVCTDRAAEARARIMAAVEQLCLDGLKVGERVKAIIAAAHCSPQTLYKNKDLWHPQPDPPTKPVKAHESAIADTPEAIRQQIINSLESTDTPPITPLGGGNEVCILESAPFKNLSPGGKERGCGGEEGLSTTPAPAPAPAPLQWPPLNWQPDYSGGDCHA